MGNCLETWTHGQQEEKKQQQQEEEEEQKAGGFVEEDGYRVKIVLTKEELEWLTLQLQSNGEKSLEDVLEEIEKGRGERVEVWKPTLESIMETPELHHDMDR